MKLVLGLGNPGAEYAYTRHNIGFIMIDKFCTQHNIGQRKTEKNFHADIIKHGDTIYAKPLTYMNKSGEAMKKIIDFYKIPVENIIVLHDEIDIPTGKIQKKIGGSPAGHNGLKSMLQHLGGATNPEANTFTRIRIGVDRPALKEQVVDWVLGKFSAAEMERIEENYAMIERLVVEHGDA